VWVKDMTQDVTALSDHATYLSNKTSFLLDATLGMINLEQNQIIKGFSIAAVVLLPPTGRHRLRDEFQEHARTRMDARASPAVPAAAA
jgi:CorA-like Mg2+ transporter protein